MAHQIASLHTANLSPDVPRWFADGVGLWTAKKILPNEDSMKALDMLAEKAAASMVKPDDFVQNRMPSDRAALVSYLFIKKLRSRSSTYSKLMEGLLSGMPFSDAFAAAYGGTPSTLLGQPDKTNRRRK